MTIWSSIVKIAVAATIAAAVPVLTFAQAGPANVRLAVMGITNYTPLAVARDLGYFKDENLNVTWTTIAQGSIAVEAVYGGSAEIGGGSIFEPMIARGNGLDLVFLAANSRIRATPPDNSGIAVRTSDPIHTAKDLVGKQVSTGLINGANYIHFQEWLRRNGVDPSSVKQIEMPFPQMADALFQKRLDAVWNLEPFLTFMTRSGNARVIAYPLQENVPQMDVSAYIAKESWVKANPDVAMRFKRAVTRATAYLVNASKEERDQWVAKYTGAKLEIVRDLNLPQFVSEFNVSTLKANLDIVVRQKLTKPFDLNVMLWKP
jgi:NitT/TauT family transport system substrate-binding protein